MTDRELIELYSAGDETALSRTQELYGAYCFSIAMSILGVRKDAEEVVNDVMLKAWEEVPRFRPENVKAYLGRLARNAAINRSDMTGALKRGGGNETIEAELSQIVSGDDGPEELLLKKELVSALNDYLAALPKAKRELFVLRYWYYKTDEQLAAHFGVSKNSVRVKLHRIREGLKKYLIERELIP